jgi:predicted GNAT family acetyltransferase
MPAMPSSVRILRADDPERTQLEREGWVVSARSWAAQLNAEDCDQLRLRALVKWARAVGQVRALTPTDVPKILALDAATVGDYPGSEATAHPPLTPASATVSRTRRAYGIVDATGALVAMTFVDVEGARAEVDFTVVAHEQRGQGLGTAVKAASVLDLISAGVETFRTGGSADNPSSITANEAVGFVRDEEWVTLAPPA